MTSRRTYRPILLAAGLLLLLIGFVRIEAAHSQATLPPPALPNGVAAGDVSATSVVLWARTSNTETLTFRLAGASEAIRRAQPVAVQAESALRPLGVAFDNLTPSTTYVYTVTTSSGQAQSGQFRTPALHGHHGLRFGVSGDGRGDWLPFQALSNAPTRDLDFFVYLGDTVYADVYSPALPDRTAQTLDDDRRKHAEVLSTRYGRNYLAELRRATAFYASIDDHEIVDDFAGGASAVTDARFSETSGIINDTARFEHAIQAFQEYYPLRWERYGREGGDGRMDDEVRLYRFRTFGDDAALFVLDARSFRDDQLAEPNLVDPADITRFLAESHDPQRTLLGQAQLSTLQRDLLRAKALGITWKFIFLPVPIQNLGTAGASDRYEGYAGERALLLAFIREHDIRNVVFVAADIHGTLINNLTYQPAFSLAAPQVQTGAWEITVGSAAAAGMIGPVVVAKGEQIGLLSAADVAFYEGLPVAPDSDSRIDDKDDFVKVMLNQILGVFGYPAVGLGGSPVNARLREGDYLSTHTFGWTKFEIDAETQQLTVTTYGINAYDAQDLAADPAEVLGRTPQVVSRFIVRPHAEVSGIFLPIVRH
jgi:phosphodiesterase/alkaline phosphatase D-like protein